MGSNIIQPFPSQSLTLTTNKLRCLSATSLCSIVSCLHKKFYNIGNRLKRMNPVTYENVTVQCLRMSKDGNESSEEKTDAEVTMLKNVFTSSSLSRRKNKLERFSVANIFSLQYGGSIPYLRTLSDPHP
jgi:hypothetical protein